MFVLGREGFENYFKCEKHYYFMILVVNQNLKKKILNQVVDGKQSIRFYAPRFMQICQFYKFVHHQIEFEQLT